MRHLYLLAAIGLLLWPFAVLAQDEEDAAPAADTPAVQEELGKLRDYVQDPEGAVQTAISDVNKVKRIRLSGYVQARYENHQGGAGLGSSTKNMFSVRRARLKAAAKPTAHTGITLQADFGGTAVSLKDAFVDWYPMAARADASWVLTLGQQKWPFGYQVVQSSSVRETPERAQFAKAFFDGERDRGVVITGPVSRVAWLQVGLFNGAGANKNDDNNSKDWSGRVRWSPLSSLDVGASAYVGKQLTQAPTAAVPPTPVFNDANGNGKQDADEPTIGVIAGSAAKPAIEATKNRYGVDAQWIPFTGLSLKGEYVQAKNGASKPHAWYALASYAVAPGLDAVAMFDRFKQTSANSKDIWHVGLTRHLTNATRARVFYQFVKDGAGVTGAKRDNNVLQAELISLF